MPSMFPLTGRVSNMAVAGLAACSWRRASRMRLSTEIVAGIAAIVICIEQCHGWVSCSGEFFLAYGSIVEYRVMAVYEVCWLVSRSVGWHVRMVGCGFFDV